MALFDFLDLENSGAGYAAAGEGAKEVLSQYRQGIKDSQEGELALAKLKELDHKIAMDEFDMQNKIADRPIDQLIKSQELNVKPAEPTDEDILNAQTKLASQVDFSKLTKEEAGALIRDQAYEFAKQREVNFDPNNPDEWRQNIVDRGLYTDLEKGAIERSENMADRLKIEMIRDQRAEKVQEGVNNRFLQGLNASFTKQQIQIGSEEKQAARKEAERLRSENKDKLNDMIKDMSKIDMFGRNYNQRVYNAFDTIVEFAIKTGNEDAIKEAAAKNPGIVAKHPYMIQMKQSKKYVKPQKQQGKPIEKSRPKVNKQDGTRVKNPRTGVIYEYKNGVPVPVGSL